MNTYCLATVCDESNQNASYWCPRLQVTLIVQLVKSSIVASLHSHNFNMFIIINLWLFDLSILCSRTAMQVQSHEFKWPCTRSLWPLKSQLNLSTLQDYLWYWWDGPNVFYATRSKGNMWLILWQPWLNCFMSLYLQSLARWTSFSISV